MELEKCSICKKRQEAIDELDRCKTASERESKRTNGFDMNSYRITSIGKREELEECCGGIVGSVCDSYGGEKQKSHHHTCAKCGKRFPERGSYSGDYVDDSLRSDDPKFVLR